MQCGGAWGSVSYQQWVCIWLQSPNARFWLNMGRRVLWEMLWNGSMLDVRTFLRMQWVSERLWVHRVSLEPVLSGCVNYSEILFIQIPQQQKDCIQGVRLKVNTVFNTLSVSDSGKIETLILLVVVQHNIVSCRKVPFLEKVCALSLMEKTEMRTSLWRGASCPAPLVFCYVKEKLTWHKCFIWCFFAFYCQCMFTKLTLSLPCCSSEGHSPFLHLEFRLWKFVLVNCLAERWPLHPLSGPVQPLPLSQLQTKEVPVM